MILLTGFERFSHFTQNPSELIIRDFPEVFQNNKVIKKVLPVSWKISLKEYKIIIESLKVKPRLVVMTGVYSGRKTLIERYAWNLAFGLDNENKFKIGFIMPRMELRLKSVLNLENTISFLHNSKEIILSSYPGLFLCNYIYYWALLLAEGKYPVVFIHFPSKNNIEKLKENFYKIIKVFIEIL